MNSMKAAMLKAGVITEKDIERARSREAQEEWKLCLTALPKSARKVINEVNKVARVYPMAFVRTLAHEYSRWRVQPSPISEDKMARIIADKLIAQLDAYGKTADEATRTALLDALDRSIVI